MIKLLSKVSFVGNITKKNTKLYKRRLISGRQKRSQRGPSFFFFCLLVSLTLSKHESPILFPLNHLAFIFNLKIRRKHPLLIFISCLSVIQEIEVSVNLLRMDVITPAQNLTKPLKKLLPCYFNGNLNQPTSTRDTAPRKVPEW